MIISYSALTKHLFQHYSHCAADQMEPTPMERTQTATLPRIYSHQRFTHRGLSSNPKPPEEQPTRAGPARQHSQSTLQSTRNLHSANTSKAVKLQVTTAAYHTKIQHLQTQESILSKDIESVKAEIAQLRLRRKGAEDSVSVASSRTTWTVCEEGRGKIEGLRRRLDKQRERAKKTMAEVDRIRRDIQTTKVLNAQLAAELESWDKQLSAESALADELEQTLAAKTAMIQKKKIEMVHKKAKIIKEYDAIRHRLDNELNTQGGPKTPNNFYLTDLVSSQQPKREAYLAQNSPKGHKANRVEYYRQKMQEWAGQAESIKEKVGAQSLEEAEQKLLDLHEQNYHYYRFVNQRVAALQELRQRNAELKQQKAHLQKEALYKPQSKAKEAIVATKMRLAKTESAQNDLKTKLALIEQSYQKTRAFVCELVRESGLRLPIQESEVAIEEQVTKESLAAFLQAVLELKQGSNPQYADSQ